MDTRYLVWGMGGFIALSLLCVVATLLFAMGESPAAPAPGGATGAQGPGSEGGSSRAQERVLRGFDVAFWGEGRPFVRIKDRFSDEVDTVNLVSYLMFEPQYAETGPSDEGGYTYKRADPKAVENTYRLGLCHEHGLFGMAADRREAAYCYRIAAMAGHSEAQVAAQRLGGGK
ncbi:hypothetical protein EDM80_00395 [bacterium]|nr:MAG: hypothetical protein EDM80_00395 [bacterium]RIK65546.1 MAG: hypothetical protein DCC64_00045 [Planctomycetota bacterium]